MANDCCGLLKVVSKNKATIERLKKILKYEDNEFFISRCRDCTDASSAHKDRKSGEFWVQDFWVDGAWNCERFFTTTETRMN